MTNETAYEKILKKVKYSVDWDKHAIACYEASQDKVLNQPTNRFDKSHLLSFHLEKFSGGEIRYVDEDGWDFETPERLEDKTTSRMLMTKAGNKKRRISVMLRNTMGDKKITQKQFRQSIKFKGLLLRQTGGLLGEQLVALLDPLKLEDKDVKFTKDQIKLNFDSEKLDWIYDPNQEQKLKLQKAYEIYKLKVVESYSVFKNTMTNIYVEESQNKLDESFLEEENGENIEKTNNNDSSIQGEQKAAA